MLVKITTKHESNSLFTFGTHKRFAVFIFLLSCCVNCTNIKSSTGGGGGGPPIEKRGGGGGGTPI